MIDQLGGRKILAGAIILLVGLAVVLLKGDIPPNLLSLLQVIFGAFVLGNGIEHVAGAVSSRVEATQQPRPAVEPAHMPSAPSSAPDPVLNQILANTEEIRAAVATTQQGMSVILQIAGVGRNPQST